MPQRYKLVSIKKFKKKIKKKVAETKSVLFLRQFKHQHNSSTQFFTIMHVQEYNFYRIVGTSDKFVKDILPLIEELNDGERLAYFAFVDYKPSKNVGIVVGIHDYSKGLDTDLTYIGYVMARHSIVPETVTYFKPDIELDLTNPAAFTDDLPF